ncbi:MAG TPA: cysteine desulfurase NifS [Armatimonadetes bacterium]|nr:cysteine desulfurase NifS [Armatimonadota bacterium]
MIYLDHAATTRPDESVVEAMLPYLQEEYGNPSSLYLLGRRARQAVDEVRELVADFIGCRPREIIFTSGGSESDNLALRGVAYANRSRGRHIITSAIEHHAVLHTCGALEKEGFEVTYLPVDQDGLVSPESVAEAIRPDTILISIMHANNEIGVIQPLVEIGRLAQERGIPFHTDAVQTVGKIPLNVEEWGVDLLSMSAHKIYGPKGVGFLYVRRRIKFQPQITGGAQEYQRRAGTENVPGIVGLGAAVRLMRERGAQIEAHCRHLRDRLLQGLRERIPEMRLNGHPTKRLANNLNVCFAQVEGESLLLMLDAAGIAASSGSACTSGSTDPSHVLLALGLPPDLARGSLRLTLGKDNTEEEIDTVLEVLPALVERLRSLSLRLRGNSKTRGHRRAWDFAELQR